MSQEFFIPSKNQIEKAGNILRKKDSKTGEYNDALNILSNWRNCHLYPINTFQATLRKKLATGFGESPIVAQRQKRAKTIIEKLKDLPKMSLARMQDIAGIRAIVSSNSQVRRLESEYRDGSRFAHELQPNPKDYISAPKPDGYRSVHLVYKYKNTTTKGKRYNGLLVELQIRTKLQHSWATALETIEKWQSITIKTREANVGEKLWQEFFAATSSAFAHIEETTLVPGYEHLNSLETFQEVTRRAKELKVIDRLKAYKVVIEKIEGERKNKKSFYHLIILNTTAKTVSYESFGRDESEIANAAYTAYERRAANGESIDPVLVSAGPLSTAKRAYPSFFSNTNEFIENLQKIIDKTK